METTLFRFKAEEETNMYLVVAFFETEAEENKLSSYGLFEVRTKREDPKLLIVVLEEDF